jgi:DNA-binding beta-propeller fold protein YncE
MAEATSDEEVSDKTTIETTISGGKITVNTCEDKDADGICGPGGTLPPGVLACLTDSNDAPVGSCQPVPATFQVEPGVYKAHLEFTGKSQGYYPTIPSTTVEVNQCGHVDPILPAVDPIHPKNVAVHAGLNKVYVAFQGPAEKSGNKVVRPYPFVAVIDGQTDEVLDTIPGGANGIGREPWGVAVSGDNVYVGSFAEGRISVINANNDTVIKNITAGRDDFQPTTAVVNPTNGWVHFPDYKGGRIVMVAGLDIIAQPVIHIAPASFSPFEMVVAADGKEGHNFVTMRDAIVPNRYKLASLSGRNGELNHPDNGLPNGGSGPPHAIGLWQQPGMSEPRFFVTYADDPRPTNEPFPNPNKLAVYSFPLVNPKDVLQRNVNVVVGNYAEAGLIYDQTTNQMFGTFGGFPYDASKLDQVACNGGNSSRGGTYTVNFDGNAGPGFKPNVVVGSPPLLSATPLNWNNPFEIAVNPNNDKVYVTDRCWNDFAGGSQRVGGAVLIYDRNGVSQAASTETLPPVVDEARLLGDTNGDGVVDITDLAFIANHYGTQDLAADINGDGQVDIVDMSIAASNYGP